MSHYVESIAYVGEKPWHGIGFEMPKGATPDEMIKAADLDWTVSKRKVKLADSPHSELTKHFALVRDSDDRVLSMVGPRYTPVQNHKIFEFFSKFCDSGKMTMETAGSLMDGRYVWALAKFTNGFKLSKRDQIQGYMLLSSPYELNRSLVIQFTPVRVVCWNTLNFSLGSNLRGKGDYVIRLPHTREFDETAQEAAATSLGLATDQMAEFENAAKLLAVSPAAFDNVMEYWTGLFNLEDTIKKAKEKDRLPKMIMLLTNAYQNGAGSNLHTAKETWWGALNAVTYIIDHNRGYKPDSFLVNAWFGPGASVKRHALQGAIERAEQA